LALVVLVWSGVTAALMAGRYGRFAACSSLFWAASHLSKVASTESLDQDVVQSDKIPIWQ
jgi:hypothetical protein